MLIALNAEPAFLISFGSPITLFIGFTTPSLRKWAISKNHFANFSLLFIIASIGTSLLRSCPDSTRGTKPLDIPKITLGTELTILFIADRVEEACLISFVSGKTSLTGITIPSLKNTAIFLK